MSKHVTLFESKNQAGGSESDDEWTSPIAREWTEKDHQDLLSSVDDWDMAVPALSESEVVLVKEAWNKVLAWKDMFMEAMAGRLLALCPELGGLRYLGSFTPQLASNLFLVLDAAVADLDPATEVIHRETFPRQGDGAAMSAALADLTTGMRPGHWLAVRLCWLFALDQFTPYFEDTEREDTTEALSSIFSKESSLRSTGAAAARDLPVHVTTSVLDRFFLKSVMVPALVHMNTQRNQFPQEVITGMRRWWEGLTRQPHKLEQFAEDVAQSVAEHAPELMEHVPKFDPWNVVSSIVSTLVGSAGMLAGSDERKRVEELGIGHKSMMLPSWAYPLFGLEFLDVLERYCPDRSLCQSFSRVYLGVARIMAQPIAAEEALLAKADSFYNILAREGGWTTEKLDSRLSQIGFEIASTGTYHQTSSELEYGARLCWRNSTKCVGRINWSTMKVRDMRNVSDPDEIFRECCEHLRLATCGDSFASVMTVFRPLSPGELWGPRFWNAQFVRFAAWRMDDGSILGDPANLQLTDAILARTDWVPPETKTRFDMLPMVLEVPRTHDSAGESDLHVMEFPLHLRHEVKIVHPTNAKIGELGLKWCAVPTISNFKMCIGGIEYNMAPFNGWFMEMEIARNLFERYDVGEEVAGCLDLDTSSLATQWKTIAFAELCRAIVYSFTEQNMTMVDHQTASKQFYSHCKRERESGREVPGQWSWIGGLVGPTCPVWHREMRDFIPDDQMFRYSSDVFRIKDADDLDKFTSRLRPASSLQNGSGAMVRATTAQRRARMLTPDLSQRRKAQPRPRVLILFGSETGTAEMFAAQIAKGLMSVHPTVASLNAYADEKNRMVTFTHILVVTSTFGDGGPPFNASEFLKTPMPSLGPGKSKHAEIDFVAGTPVVQYAVMALGNSMYKHYCEFGTAVDTAFRDAGAVPLTPTQLGDEQHGQVAAFSEWCDVITRTILEGWKPSYGADANRIVSRVVDPAGEPAPVSDTVPSCVGMEVPRTISCHVACPVVSNRELLENTNALRSTREIIVDISGMDSSYIVGDHLSILPLVASNVVLELCEVLGVDPDQLFSVVSMEIGPDGTELGSCPAQMSFPQPITYRRVFSMYMDPFLTNITVGPLISLLVETVNNVIARAELPPSALVECGKKLEGWRKILTAGMGVKRLHMRRNMVGARAQDAEKEMLETEIIGSYHTIGGLLKMVYDCGIGSEDRLNPGEVISLMHKIKSRYYSISSSPIAMPGLVRLTVGVVKNPSPLAQGSIRLGLCSNYLASLQPGELCHAMIRPSSFRLPANPAVPCIYVAAGTGIAPFIGFLEECERSGNAIAPSTDHLFFGCRGSHEWLYRDQLEQWKKTGLIGRMDIAFSREPSQPVGLKYVSGLIRSKGETVWKMISDPTCHYYVCGDAAVADSAYDALIKVAMECGSLSRVAAERHIVSMRVEGRYHLDVWGKVLHLSRAKSGDAAASRSRMAKKVWQYAAAQIMGGGAIGEQPEDWLLKDPRAARKLRVASGLHMDAEGDVRNAETTAKPPGDDNQGTKMPAPLNRRRSLGCNAPPANNLMESDDTPSVAPTRLLRARRASIAGMSPLLGSNKLSQRGHNSQNSDAVYGTEIQSIKNGRRLVEPKSANRKPPSTEKLFMSLTQRHKVHPSRQHSVAKENPWSDMPPHVSSTGSGNGHWQPTPPSIPKTRSVTLGPAGGECGRDRHLSEFKVVGRSIS